MPEALRIFVSSPGDVIAERRRAQLVIEKLAKAYARFFTAEAILWEVEPMLASGHFQDQITPPSETDILVLIVWSRLGTPLPEQTETRAYHGIDGRVPVTGTEWEFEDALAGHQKRGAPDLLAYRKQADPVVSLKDRSAKAAAEEQWDKLDAFWNRWFVNRGEFRAGFSEFSSLDEFEDKLEQNLRSLFDRRVQALRDQNEGAPAPVWTQGSPFRGLESYRFEHAPIYFGRSAVTKIAVEQLTGNAERGCAFLLILGASGAGKSSLAQAGILPSLSGRGIVPEIGLWRWAVMRPAGHREGPFAALAEALTSKTALPELLTINRQDTAALARHLRASADDPTFPIVAALNQIETAARSRGDLLAIETAQLAIVVDQLEELVTLSDVTAETRIAFIRCIDRLARSGRVFLVATMRSDYWHRAADMSELVAMAAGTGKIDLLPATPDEIFEMIRQPAEAAGIEFEADPNRDIKLDATLAAQAANEPGALPLLSFLLDELYKKDVQTTGHSTLTYASMRELGGLSGAIANRAEAVFASLPLDVQAALPKVLRAIVTVSRSGAEPTARAAPMAIFAESSTERRLVEALLDPQVRLLVGEGDGDGARIRLAHEALITHWERAKRQIVQDRDDLRTRGMVEEAEAEWRAADIKHKRSYLLRDPKLASALDLVRRWQGELSAASFDFIEASRRRARFRQQAVVAAAGFFALVAVLASIFGILAYQARNEAALQRDLANRNRQVAEQNAQRAADNERLAKANEQLAKANEQQAKQERDQALIAQSRFLASLADQQVSAGEPAAAMLTAAAALPRNMLAPDRPVTPEAVNALIRASKATPDRAVLLGHTDHVTRLSYSPDGTRVVTASDDNTARIWAADTGVEIAVLDGHTGNLFTAVFSPDGERVLTASDDGTARIWDADTGDPIKELDDHRTSVRSAYYSPDGSQIVTGSLDNTAIIWDAKSGEKRIVLSGHTDGVYSAVFSPDGRHVLTASGDHTARIWDAATGASLGVLTGHTSRVFNATYSPKGDRVLTVSDDRTARLWDAATGAQLKVFNYVDVPESATFGPDGERIVTTGRDQMARMWDANTGKQIRIFAGHTNIVWSAAFSPDGRELATASKDKTARLWDVDSGKAIKVLRGHTDGVWYVTFSPDGKRVATASDDDTGRIWQASDERQFVELTGHKDAVVQAVFSPNGKLLATASNDSTARLWDSATGKPIATLTGHTDAVSAVAFGPDGTRLATASQDKTARIWDLQRQAQIALLKGHSDMVTGVAFSPDGTRVLTSSQDGTSRLWDAKTGAPLKSYSGAPASFSRDGQGIATSAGVWNANGAAIAQFAAAGKEAVTAVAFSPDGSRVVTAAAKDALIRDARSGAQLAVLKGHTGNISSASFSPDGDRVVTASEDNTVRIWDARSGAQLLNFGGHTGSVWNAVFSPDGRRVVSASADDTARVWDAQTGVQLGVLVQRDNVWNAAFSSDGRHIVTASADASARIWPTWPLLTADTVTLFSASALGILSPEQRSRLFLAVHNPPANAASRNTNDVDDMKLDALKKSAAAGNPSALRRLAELYEEGDGVDQNLPLALSYYVAATRLFEQDGQQADAQNVAARRGSLARALPPEDGVKAIYGGFGSVSH
jgi:WD40 repeat protein